jgi:uncharacterized protein YdaU (DUF1376 family)
MKETFYFSHDYHAREDEKIMRLVAKNGWEAYGLFWAIVEKLYEEGGILEKDYDSLAFALRTDSERIANVIESGLFEFRNDKFYSKSVNARLVKRKGKSEMARQSANLRWSKPKVEDANAMRTQCERNAIKESKVKESKVNTNTVISKIHSKAEERFEEFWNLYKKKEDKPAALKKWKGLTAEEKNKIIEYIPKYLATKKVTAGYQKNPANFLRDRSWENEIKNDEIDTTGWSDMKRYNHFGVAGLKQGFSEYN